MRALASHLYWSGLIGNHRLLSLSLSSLNMTPPKNNAEHKKRVAKALVEDEDGGWGWGWRIHARRSRKQG